MSRSGKVNCSLPLVDVLLAFFGATLTVPPGFLRFFADEVEEATAGFESAVSGEGVSPRPTGALASLCSASAGCWSEVLSGSWPGNYLEKSLMLYT